jgi:hypothetical protein
LAKVPTREARKIGEGKLSFALQSEWLEALEKFQLQFYKMGLRPTTDKALSHPLEIQIAAMIKRAKVPGQR